MKNIDFENCNNFKIRNKWTFSFCFITGQILLMQKLEKGKYLFFSDFSQIIGRKPAYVRWTPHIYGSQRCPLDRGFSVISFSTHVGTHDVTTQVGRGALAIMGCHFHGYTFCLKILEQDINSEEKLYSR